MALKPTYVEEAAKAIPPLVDEYMRLLGLSGEGPVVEVKDNIGSKWLGQTVLRGEEIWIQVQARAIADPETLEKILAHEMAHFAEMSTIDEHELALLRLGRRLPSLEHGEKFWRFANIINETKGTDFVTEKSDASYELTENTRSYFLLVTHERERFMWRWAAKRTPAIDAIIQRLEGEGAVLVESTDDQFLLGAKMGKRKIGWSVAKEGSDQEAALREIFEETKEADHGI
jgi:hypothetical protein